MPDFSNPAATAIEDAPSYTAGLIQALGDRDPLEILREMPQALANAIDRLSPELLAKHERPGKWSIVQVIQHLADSDMIGGVRMRMVLAHERPEIIGYDQDLWANRLNYRDANPEDALREFSTIRRANVRLLEKTSGEDRNRVGVHSERGEESISRMMQLYAGHDIVHLRQVARIRKAVEG